MRIKIENIAVFVLLAMVAVQCIASMSQKSVTNDEIVHFAAGYSYIKTGDFRLNPEHPHTIKLLSGLAILPLNPRLPLEHESWEQSLDVNNERAKWAFGRAFMFSYKNPDKLLFFARLPIVLLALLLGFYIYKWASELYGTKAGIFALFLYSFSPNILAHSRLVTTDLGLACLGFITTYYLWKLLNDFTPKRAVVFGVLLALMLAVKFSSLFFLPAFALLALLFFVIKRDVFKTRIVIKKSEINKFVKICIIIFISFMFVFSATYFFTNIQSFIDGIKIVFTHSTEGHLNFLLGEHSIKGWWYYFIVAFFVKTPIPTIIFLALSFLLYRKLNNNDRNIININELFLIVPAVIFFSAFFFNHINIGLRHVLPIYPFIFVFSSRIINIKLKKMIIPTIIFFLLCTWYLASSVMIYPHYLAYFNEFTGGPDNGHNYLIDSNLDWGQDLKGLKKYMDANGISDVNLKYFGTDSPEYREIKYDELQCYPMNGISAISVNLLQILNINDRECHQWLKEFEPIAKIGYSIFIYNLHFSDEDIKKGQNDFCMKGCITRCEKVNLKYGRSAFFNNSCDCECIR